MNIELGGSRVRFLELADGEGNDSHRIGGKAPESIVPRHAQSRYLLTVGLSETAWVSIFLAGDTEYFEAHPLSIREEGDEVVEVIFHNQRARCDDDRFAGDLSPQALALGTLAVDTDPETKHLLEPSDRTKMGGAAFLLRGSTDGREVLVATLQEQGFEQFLQLDLLDLNSSPRGLFVSGESPLEDSLFHLFLKPQGENYEWRCFWQY